MLPSQSPAAPSRCVIMIMVLPAAPSFNLSIRIASVALSNAEAGSSSSIILPPLSRPRAMAILWAWPSLSPVPDSPQTVSSPSGSSCMKSAAAL